MKIRNYFHAISLLTLFLTVLSGGCIHTYPDGESVNPRLISLTLSLTLKENLVEGYHGSAPLLYPFRTIIEIGKSGRNICRCEASMLLNVNEESPSVSIDVPTRLPAGEYDLTVWMETIDPSSSLPLHYDATDLTSIRVKPYWESLLHTPAKATLPICAFFSGTIDLRAYQTEWNAIAVYALELTPPVGILSFEATDAEAFIRHYPEAAAGACMAEVEITSPSANSFNLPAALPLSYSTGRRYSTPVIFQPADILPLAAFPLFTTPEGESFTVNLTIYNPARQILARCRDIPAVIFRDCKTTVRDALLSDFFESPVGVEYEWEGEIEIEN